MTPAEQFLARASELATRLGVPFFISVYDAIDSKGRLSYSKGAPEKLKPFLLKHLGAVEEHLAGGDDIQEVSWNDQL
jgi:hypothetical protein